jgi:hypothetical protein
MLSSGATGRLGRARNITQAIANAVAPIGKSHHMSAFTPTGYAWARCAKSPGLAAACAFPLRTCPLSRGLQRVEGYGSDTHASTERRVFVHLAVDEIGENLGTTPMNTVDAPCIMLCIALGMGGETPAITDEIQCTACGGKKVTGGTDALPVVHRKSAALAS